MIKIHGDIFSGNCYKIKLLLELLSIPHLWRHVDILAKQTRTPEFLRKNANGKIPLLEFADGSTLAESNAILNFLAEGTPFLPASGLARAKVLQWQFFEQYSHEPYIAVARYIAKYLAMPVSRAAEYAAKQTGGHHALQVMEQQLSQTPFIVGEAYTIADISLYAYTHVAHEGGFDLSSYPHIVAWMQRVQTFPGHVTMEQFAPVDNKA